MQYKNWIEINRKALRHNLSQLKKIAGDAKVAVVLKANAYGHGLEEVASIVKNSVEWIAVDNLDEAFALKSLNTKAKVLILGYTPILLIKETIQNNFSFTVYNKDTLKNIASLKLKKRANIHLKIETGLNRQGISIDDIPEACSYIKRYNKSINLEGISSHFANVDGVINLSFAKKQLGRFLQANKKVSELGFKPVRHLSASAASMVFPQARLDMIRPGISLYGIWPSEPVRKKVSKRVRLEPVLSWKGIIAQIKTVKKGESVSYGRMWFASKNTKVAVIPIGYSDGLDRKLSNKGKVLIRGKFAPIVGRVAMNMIVVNIDKMPEARLEDEVVIIGKQGKRKILAWDLAKEIDTIPYEIVARLNALTPRLVT